MGGEPGRIKSGGILGSIGIYKKSLGLYLLIFVALIVLSQFRGLQANDPPTPGFNSDPAKTINYELREDGNLYQGRSRVRAEIFRTETTYRYRVQAVNRPGEFLDELFIVISLPFTGSDSTVGQRIINDGSVSETFAVLYDPRTIVFAAVGVAPRSQLAIEFEVPQAFISRSAAFSLRESMSTISPSIWAAISISLPSLAALLLFITALARTRRVQPIRGSVEKPPSRLAPAMVGILLRGRLTNRDIAATLIDLAHRGHIIIRHISNDDFRFRRHIGSDKLEDFEQALLDQIFGVQSQSASAEEISFSLSQEVFSKRISQSFILAYQRIGELGFFHTNPLKLHLRYQISGLILFVIGIVGFLMNLFLISGAAMFLLFWLGMIGAALLVLWFSRGIPSRTIYGDRELASWLGFARYLSSKEPVNYVAHSQDKYLSYLPYAIVFDVEAEWTKRFYSMPFFQPDWYVAANVTTIDQFANKIFPLFGYLSHVLAVTSQPSAR